MNHVVIKGNLTRAPEKKIVGNGLSLANFTVAVNDKRKGRDGKDIEKTSFVDVTAFGFLADKAEECDKGWPVIVFGRLEQQSWTSQSGEKRSKLVVIANWFDVVATKRQPQQQQDEYSQPDEQQDIPF